jgi:hypothetical protein
MARCARCGAFVAYVTPAAGKAGRCPATTIERAKIANDGAEVE